jgi:hypothetical protein
MSFAGLCQQTVAGVAKYKPILPATILFNLKQIK